MVSNENVDLSGIGVMIYKRRPYYASTPFSAQIMEMDGVRDDVSVNMDDEVSIFMKDGELCARLADGSIISSDNLPKWVMMRADDWKLAYALEQIGCKVFPSAEYIKVSSDKALTHIKLKDALNNYDALLMSGDVDVWKLATPYMLKGRSGHGGAEVTKVTKPSKAYDGIRAMKERGIEPLLQALAPSPDDLRVYIMEHEILYAILRTAEEGSDVANFCNGGQGHVYKLSDEERAIIGRALEELGANLGFISIDFFISEDGTLVLNEMNSFPGLRGLVQNDCADGFVSEYIEWLDAAVSDSPRSAEDVFSSIKVIRPLAK